MKKLETLQEVILALSQGEEVEYQSRSNDYNVAWHPLKIKQEDRYFYIDVRHYIYRLKPEGPPTLYIVLSGDAIIDRYKDKWRAILRAKQGQPLPYTAIEYNPGKVIYPE